MNIRACLTIIAIVTATTSAALAEEKNPFTGEPLNQPKKPAAADKQPVVPQIPPPPVNVDMNKFIPPPMPMNNTAVQTKYIDPLERFQIDGIVNDNVIIKDLKNTELVIYKKDFDTLPNGCVVKYPQVLCGESGARALKTFEDKNAIATRYMDLSKEYGSIKQQNEAMQNKITEYENKLKQLDPKNKATDSELKKISAEAASLAKENALLKKDKADLEEKIKTIGSECSSKAKKADDELVLIRKTIAKYESEAKEAFVDMTMITNLLYNSPMNTDYNVPKIGKFKGVLSGNLFYAFVPLAQREKADAYFKQYNKRAYKTESYIMYINDKKFLEE